MELIKFTQEQQSKMVKCFGSDFVEALPSKLDDYAGRWQLSDLSLIEYYSNNCLLTCRSEVYGDCVLKIFGCGKDIYIHEIRVLKEVNGTHQYVRAYEIDEERGALLLERVIPGETLKTEPSLDRRLSAFIDAWKNAHIVPHEPNLYESYLEVIERAAKASWACGDIPVLKQAAQNMATICRELYNKYSERTLLHSDLHGDNLLKNSRGEYIIVDPHGRTGPPICDLGRYIANEYFDAERDTKSETVKYVMKQLSDKINLPRIDVARAFFVDITLMTCWGAEAGVINCDNVHTHVDLLQEDINHD
ncbi:MAG: aminoglycoside phosphotransferase family protein [Eubacteriales bacterium]|nr:aminoglycoside phosphotransferase family protein [Oscillospiraceae bacterium]MDD4495498.1 aminoglycoside phosphotransferase family protein [Eubacteriales bacterium]